MEVLQVAGLLLILVSSTRGNADLRLTKKIVSQEEKASILDAKDDVTAFSNYMKIYDDVTSSKLTESTNPTVTKKRINAQKRNFVHNLKEIIEHNKKFARGETTYSMTVNSFTIMSGSERRQFLSLRNVSGSADGRESMVEERVRRAAGNGEVFYPDSLDWRKGGWMSGVKIQGYCSSSWAFAAIDLLEFAYKRSTGNMIEFSGQQLLDCTYDDIRDAFYDRIDACHGGSFTDAWDWIMDNNHMATMDDYRYTGQDSTCKSQRYTNRLEGVMKLTGYVHLPEGDENKIVEALQSMPLAVGIYAQEDLFEMGDEIFDGCKSSKRANHAVTLTGYTECCWILKNSWGEDWGNGGYGRFARRGNICNILSDAYYITYQDLNPSDGQVSGWETAVKDTKIEVDMLKYSLELQTSRTGRGDYVSIKLYTEQNQGISSLSYQDIYWRLFSPYYYQLYDCTPWLYMPNVPIADKKIWRITKTNKLLAVTCNEVEVFKVVFADVDNFPECFSRWRRDVAKIAFDSDDDTEMYRKVLLPAGAAAPDIVIKSLQELSRLPKVLPDPVICLKYEHRTYHRTRWNTKLTRHAKVRALKKLNEVEERGTLPDDKVLGGNDQFFSSCSPHVHLLFTYCYLVTADYYANICHTFIDNYKNNIEYINPSKVGCWVASNTAVVVVYCKYL